MAIEPVRAWARSQIRLLLGILLPLVVVLPLRAFLFPDEAPLTVVLLAPATEEVLKLAGTFVALIVLAVLSSSDGGHVLTRRLFLVPLFVGGVYGLYEGLALYPDESGLTLVVRMWAHAGFVVLGLGGALWFWRTGFRTLPGAWFGLSLAVAAHDAFNSLSLASAFAPISFVEQSLFAAGLFLVAVVVMERVLRTEPSPDSARRFLLPVGRRDQA